MNKNQIAKAAWNNPNNLSEGNVQKAKRQVIATWLMDPLFRKGLPAMHPNCEVWPKTYHN